MSLQAANPAAQPNSSLMALQLPSRNARERGSRGSMPSSCVLGRGSGGATVWVCLHLRGNDE